MPAAVLAAVWLGTIPGWLTLAGVAALVILMRGGQVGPALGYLREANATLQEANRALLEKVADQAAELERLRGRTDLDPVLHAVLEQSAGHEARAQGRFERTVTILDLIAERLGPDPNGTPSSG